MGKKEVMRDFRHYNKTLYEEAKRKGINLEPMFDRAISMKWTKHDQPPTPVIKLVKSWSEMALGKRPAKIKLPKEWFK